MQSGLSLHTNRPGKRLFTTNIQTQPEKRFEFDKTLIALVSSWGGLICDLGIQIGTLSTEIVTTYTTPNIVPNGNWIHIIGHSNGGAFSIFMPSQAAAYILQLADENLNIEKLEGGDAALIFEHLFTYQISTLENLLGAELSIVSITDVDAPVSGELLGFEFDIEGEKHQGAIQITGDLHYLCEKLAAPHSFPEEKQIDNRMIVHLGPVVVSARQAYLARIGEMIDCGVEPSSVIKGVLMRSDGRYWPIHIEDEQVEIAGPLAGPVQISNETTENVFITFGLGEVSLSAFERHTLSQGAKINIQRLPENGAHIYYQVRPFGKGHLSLLGSNLSVTLDSIGAFKV